LKRFNYIIFDKIIFKVQLMKIRAQLLMILVFLVSIKLNGQTCDFGTQNFTGSSPANPPSGWVRAVGVDIGGSFPADAMNDPAVGFNLVAESIISPTVTCLDTLKFQWKASGASSNFDVKIYYTQDDINASPNWILANTIITTGSVSPTTLQTMVVNIMQENLVAPFNIRIKWEMTRRVGGSFYLDNVCFNSGPCFVTPTKYTSTLGPGCKLEETNVNVKTCATDNNGYVDTNFVGNITLAKLSGPGTIGGTLSGNAIKGCFTTNLTFSAAGSYTLQSNSSSNSLTGISPTIPIASECIAEDTIRVMSYNILNFPLGRNDCSGNNLTPGRWDTLAKLVNYFKPDVLMVCELQNEAGADSILRRSFNINGVNYYARAVFTENLSSSSEAYNNMMFYNTRKITLKNQYSVVTPNRDINRYEVYFNDPGLATHNDTTFLNLYMAHLKAGSAPADSLKRKLECEALRAYIDTHPQTNFVLGGDLNLYTNQEAAYQSLKSGPQPFQDPLNLEGPWDSNFAYASTHTQAARCATCPVYECGINGGCDSRFDFLLTSPSIINNEDNIQYMANTYKAVGNNGSIYNKSVNDPANTSGLPPATLNSLFYMSDHLPVMMDLKVAYPSISCPSLVTNQLNSGKNSLRNILACVNSNGTVAFDAGLINKTITIDTTAVTISKNVHIVASASDNVSIKAVSPAPATLPHLFTINAGISATIEGLTLCGAFGPEGSAIINYGNLTLKNITIKNGGIGSVLSTVKNMPGATLTILENCSIE
jgi:hypothetical protein